MEYVFDSFSTVILITWIQTTSIRSCMKYESIQNNPRLKKKNWIFFFLFISMSNQNILFNCEWLLIMLFLFQYKWNYIFIKMLISKSFQLIIIMFMTIEFSTYTFSNKKKKKKKDEKIFRSNRVYKIYKFITSVSTDRQLISTNIFFVKIFLPICEKICIK